ncbi:hypothetical protein KY340_02275 [Candidatus Woesearchaeota archaeon]|nr:hypothetical protein [Candidatus Woesearchaeota archaeon]
MAKKILRRGRIFRVKRDPETKTIRGSLKALPNGAEIEFVPVSNLVFEQYDEVLFALTRGDEMGRNKKAIIVKKIKEGRKR